MYQKGKSMELSSIVAEMARFYLSTSPTIVHIIHLHKIQSLIPLRQMDGNIRAQAVDPAQPESKYLHTHTLNVYKATKHPIREEK